MPLSAQTILALGCKMRHAPLMHLFTVLVLFAGVRSSTAATFVTRSGNQLYADGEPFYHMGFNAAWMPSSAAYNMKQRVDDVLDAAQRLGLRVLRTWAFNDAFPYLPGKYNEKQGQGLDYVIAAAGQRGIRVELALVNFWPAYLAPETWLAWAEGTAANGKTVTDFYRSPKVLQLLERHIYAITGRVNSVTGVAYKDDPTIIGYNLFNEPRCPGCTPEDMAARNAFISALAQTLKAAAPKQLTFSGTEGFFAEGDPQVGWNPGHGSQCEGEDWTSEIRLFDVATTHMYWRQMEGLKQSGWERPGFDFYIQYLYRKLQLYSDEAGKSGRPVVVEEFGLTKRFFNMEEIKVVVTVVADALIAAKRAGKPLMGAWFWQAAPPGDPDVGGYDLALTRPPSGRVVGLGNPPIGPGKVKPFISKITDRPQGAASQVVTVATNDVSAITQAVAASSASATGSSASPTSATGSSASSASATDSSTVIAQSGSSSSSSSALPVTGRRMLSNTGPVVVVASDDELDVFRRGKQRAECSVRVANWPEQTTPWVVDVAAYKALVAGHDVVDIIAEATRLLNE